MFWCPQPYPKRDYISVMLDFHLLELKLITPCKVCAFLGHSLLNLFIVFSN